MAEQATIKANQIEGLPELIREQLKAIRQEDARPDLQDVEEVRRSPARKLIHLEAKVDALDAKVDQRFDSLRSEMDQRFEVVDQRFSALKLEMDQRFGALDSKVDQLRSEMDRRFTLLQWAIGLIYPFLLAVMGKLFLMK